MDGDVNTEALINNSDSDDELTQADKEALYHPKIPQNAFMDRISSWIRNKINKEEEIVINWEGN